MKKKKVNNNILLNNIKFFGEQYAPSKHITGPYNQRKVCKFLDVNESNLSNWKKNIQPVARTTIIRMADKLSLYFNDNITPDMLISRSLKDYIDLTKIVDEEELGDNHLDEKIIHLLNKYPEQKKVILQQLQIYDMK